MIGLVTVGDVSACRGRLEYPYRDYYKDVVSIQLPIQLDDDGLWRLCKTAYEFVQSERQRDMPDDWRGRG